MLLKTFLFNKHLLNDCFLRREIHYVMIYEGYRDKEGIALIVREIIVWYPPNSFYLQFRFLQIQLPTVNHDLKI